MYFKILRFGRKIKFPNEKRTELYMGHGEGSIGSKNLIWHQIHRSAAGYAGWQVGAA